MRRVLCSVPSEQALRNDACTTANPTSLVRAALRIDTILLPQPTRYRWRLRRLTMWSNYRAPCAPLSTAVGATQTFLVRYHVAQPQQEPNHSTTAVEMGDAPHASTNWQHPVRVANHERRQSYSQSYGNPHALPCVQPKWFCHWSSRIHHASLHGTHGTEFL